MNLSASSGRGTTCEGVGDVDPQIFSLAIGEAVRAQGGNKFDFLVMKDPNDGVEIIGIDWVSASGQKFSLMCASTRDACERRMRLLEEFVLEGSRVLAPPGFQCPENLPDAEARLREMDAFVTWITQTFGQLTVAQIVSYRLYLLEKFGCASRHDAD